MAGLLDYMKELYASGKDVAGNIYSGGQGARDVVGGLISGNFNPASSVAGEVKELFNPNYTSQVSGMTQDDILNLGMDVNPTMALTTKMTNVGKLGFDKRFDPRILEQDRLSKLKTVYDAPNIEIPKVSLVDYEGYPFITSMSDIQMLEF